MTPVLYTRFQSLVITHLLYIISIFSHDPCTLSSLVMNHVLYARFPSLVMTHVLCTGLPILVMARVL